MSTSIRRVGVMLEGIHDRGPNVRTYDSRIVRTWEAWRSLQGDLSVVRGRALLYEGINLEKEVLLADDGALWESILVRLFRHYKGAVVPGMKGAFHSSAERTGVADRFEYWEKQRDKKVTHPVGHEEFYQVRVYLGEYGGVEDVKFGGATLYPMPDEVRKVRLLAEDMLETEVKPRVEALEAEIRAEVEGLSPRRLGGLPPYFIRAHGRRFGA